MPFLYLSDGYLLTVAAWLVAGAISFVLLLKGWRRWERCPGRRRAVQMLLSIWTLLATLTALELYFAFLYDTTDSFNMTNVSKKWFEKHVRPQLGALAVRDDQVVIYRDDHPFPESLDSKQHHICFVGDSFTFGHGVKNVADRFSNLVAADGERNHPGKFAVSNLASAGADLYWIETLLDAVLGSDYRIHTVVYVICLNDIEAFDERRKTHYANLSKHAPRFFLFRDTYFFNLLYFRVWQSTIPEVRDYFSFVKASYDGEPWLRMRRKLDDLFRLCQLHETDLRIVVFPFLHNAGADYPFRRAHKQILDFCNETSIPALDLEPVLRPHVQEGLTVGPFDAHPNERAHRLAAEAITQRLLADCLESDDE